MKKLKLLFVLVLILLAATCFTACSNIDRAFISVDPHDGKDIADITNVPELSGFNFESVDEDLAYFTKKESSTSSEHLVYNLKLGKKLYSITSKNALLSMASTKVDGETVCFSVVFNYENNESFLYSAKGKLIDTVEGTALFDYAADLIRFGDKCYRIDGNGAILYAFDYPALSDFPKNMTKYDGFYYEFQNKAICIYDDELEFVSRYTVPSYSDTPFFTILEDGNILAQYIYESDSTSDDYDVIMEDDKYNVKTELFRIKSGRVKTLKCNYILRYAINLLVFPEEARENGIDPSVFPVTGNAYRIENKQIDLNDIFIYINNNGKVKEFDKINGESITNVTCIDRDRYAIETKSHTYLMNEKGDVMGDISSSNIHGKYLENPNNFTLYDSDLNPLFDFGEKSYSVHSAIGNNLWLYSHIAVNGNVIFSGSSNVIEFPPLSKTIFIKSNDLFILRDESDRNMYYIYDHNGDEIKAFTSKDKPYIVAASDDFVIIRGASSYSESNFYLVRLK